jgi:hypothetical protein
LKTSADNFKESVSSWADLAALVEHFSFYSGHDWLFRGVTDTSHALVPKIGRPSSRSTKMNRITRQRVRTLYSAEDERAILTMFKQQARPHLASIPTDDLQWLAIAQHFGLPTRLLDWSDSFLVAAWFAVEESENKKDEPGIWVARGVPSIEAEFRGDPLTLTAPRIYRAPFISPRIAAQGSVLMVCPSPERALTMPFLSKVAIERSVAFTLKKRLNACGINGRHLFPDLAGLSAHLSWLYKHDWLSGYRARGGEVNLPDSPDDPDSDS